MIGYLLSAFVFVFLLAACLTVWRERLAGSGLVAALGIQVGWSFVLAADASRMSIPFELVIAAEYVRDVAWGLVLARCLRRDSSSSVRDRPEVPGNPDEARRQSSVETTAADALGALRVVRDWWLGGWLVRLAGGLGVLALVVVLISVSRGALQGEPGLSLRGIAKYWLWGGLAFSIGGLVLVEQAARNTRSTYLWSVKHIWLAIGGLYGYDLCLFSVAMLRGSAAVEFWAVRGYVNVILGGLLAVGLSRITRWESAAFLSRRVVFFNATLLAASFFVLVMAGGSYFVRQLGGTWGGAGQILFLAAGAVVLAVAVLSEQFRAWSRVTLAKSLFPYRYDYRAEWQKLTHVLSHQEETPIYERIPKAMAGFVSCASGGLWLKDTEGAYMPVGGAFAPPEAPLEAGYGDFFGYLRDREWIFNLDEARASAALHNRASAQVALPAPPTWMLNDARMWLVIPLICEGSLVGFVVTGQPLASMRLGWEEIDLLRACGRQVASYLAFEQAAKRLAEAHQFEAMSRLSAVLMHDLRHLIAQQALVVQNAARHRGNPEFFDDAILTIDNSVKRMTRLMDELKSGVLALETHRVALSELCAEAIKRCAGNRPVPVLEVHDRGIEVVVNRERLLQVLEHVIRNAQDATPSDGSVTVHVRLSGERAIIDVVDTGAGMDMEFIRHRLFRPFDTTKGERGFGIGAFEAREFVRKCGGSVQVESTPGKGTCFAISLPPAPVLAPVETVTVHAS